MTMEIPEHLGAKALAGTVALWAVLALMAESEKARPLAVGLAATVFLASLLGHGAKAIENSRHLLPALRGG